MRNGATTLQPTLEPAPQLVGPPPGPRSAGMPPVPPLLRRAPRTRPAQGVRRLVDLEASSLLELLDAHAEVDAVEAVDAVEVVDESGLSIQDRIRLRALEAAARS